MKLLLVVLLLAGCGTYYKNPKINLRGKPGNNGSSCTTRQESTGVYVECTDGSISFIPFPEDGIDGESVVGPVGEAGSSCSVNDSGLITCTDGSSHQVNDGVDGTDGRDAQAMAVQLCPGDTAAYKEQGFVIDGELYAVYYDKNRSQVFLAKLTTGTYRTTNGSNCLFTYSRSTTQIVLSNGSGTTTHPISE